MLDILSIWKRDFGPGVMTPVQEEAIRHILRRRDALVVMPAGEDRDLCFQVPAMLMSGFTLVLSTRFPEHVADGKVLYARPWRLPQALAWLRRRPISLFVIDEVERMEEWRADHLPAYAGLGALRRRFPWVPIVALSADSDDLLRHYAFSQLWLRGWAVFEDVSSPV